MMTLIEIRQSNSEQLFAEVANKIGDFLTTLTDQEQIVIALPGGRSVVKLLDALLPALRALPDIVRNKLHFFMVDERVVDLTSPDSNFKMLNELFYSKAVAEGLIYGSQLHPFVCTPETVEDDLKTYSAELATLGGRFDLAVVGVGEDAHVAGLFPNHHSIRNTAKDFISFKDSPKPPPHRMSASRALIETSKMGVALFIGEAKSESLDKFRSEQPVEICPVSILRSLPSAVIGTDL